MKKIIKSNLLSRINLVLIEFIVFNVFLRETTKMSTTNLKSKKSDVSLNQSKAEHNDLHKSIENLIAVSLHSRLISKHRNLVHFLKF